MGVLRENVERLFALGEAFGPRISEAPDFELAAPPDCNIIRERACQP